MDIKKEFKKTILKMNLGYEYLISDYATSYMEEKAYKKEGLKEVDETIDALLSLFVEYMEKEVIPHPVGEIGFDSCIESIRSKLQDMKSFHSQ